MKGPILATSGNEWGKVEARRAPDPPEGLLDAMADREFNREMDRLVDELSRFDTEEKQWPKILAENGFERDALAKQDVCEWDDRATIRAALDTAISEEDGG